MQTPHDRSLNHADRPIHIVVLDPGDEGFLGVFYQKLLDLSYVLETGDVLVELGVDRHQLGPHCKSLSVLVLRLDMQHERNACWKPGHLLLQVLHVEVNALNDDGFIPPICTFYHLRQLSLH